MKISILIPQCVIYLRGMLHTAEMISAVRCTPQRVTHCGDTFVIEYLDEIETKFENTLVCLSGA